MEQNLSAVGAPVEPTVRPDAERAVFERWVDTERPSMHAAVRTYDESMALAHVMDAAWLAWQAGRTAERQRCSARAIEAINTSVSGDVARLIQLVRIAVLTEGPNKS